MKNCLFLLLVLSSCFSVSSRAETIAASQQQIWTSPSGGGSWPTGEQLCAQLAINNNLAQGYQPGNNYYYAPCGVEGPGYNGGGSNAYGCKMSQPVNSCWSRSTMYMNLGAYGCPSTGGWTLSGSSCTRPDCATGQTRDASGACVRDCNSIKGTSYSGYIPAGANPATVCQDGCNATVVSATNQASVGGVQVIAGSFSYSGGSCTGNNITGGTPPVCPAGQCVGLINGANSCFTCSDINKSATTYTATSDTTLKTTTYNADSTTTTAVTDTTTGTTSPSQTAPKSDQQTYCEQNPTAVSCLDTQNEPAPVEPSLDTTPTGASMFSSIKDFVQIQPSNFSHVSQCPTSSFDWNGRTFVFNQHCALVTDHWAILSTAMLTAWTVLSLFVVLKA